MGRKPLVDLVDVLRMGGNESLDLRLGEVLAIALVERVAGRVLRATTGESGMRRALT